MQLNDNIANNLKYIRESLRVKFYLYNEILTESESAMLIDLINSINARIAAGER